MDMVGYVRLFEKRRASLPAEGVSDSLFSQMKPQGNIYIFSWPIRVAPLSKA